MISNVNRPEDTILGLGLQQPLLSLTGVPKEITGTIYYCDGNKDVFSASWTGMGCGTYTWVKGGTQGYNLTYAERGYHLYDRNRHLFTTLGITWAEAAKSLVLRKMAKDVSVAAMVADSIESNPTKITKTKPKRTSDWYERITDRA